MDSATRPGAGDGSGPATGRLAYRVLTGPDDRSFCERVSAALADGYVLHGGPTLTCRDGQVIVGQALVLPEAVPS